MANLKEFNATLETTRHWLDDLMETMGVDEPTACRALRATLHELRDHLRAEEAADLAAQLPLLLRGLYFENWRPAGKPLKQRDAEAFIQRVGEAFPQLDLEHVEKMIQDVFSFLERRISKGEIYDVVNSLPKELRRLWPMNASRRQA